MNNNINILLQADSYKHSHPGQYVPGANAMTSYVEARSSKLRKVDAVTFFGLQMFIKAYLLNPITMADIDEAEAICKAHGEPFARAAFEKIVNVYGGKFPVTIKAVKEGTEVPVGNVLATIECDDPDLFWIGSFLETIFLRGIWYPTSVATVSKACKRIIYQFLQETSDDPDGQISFKLHDFGARGVSSAESAGIGGLAHLVNFMGTDTMPALMYARRYYGCEMAAFSIPAAEHSTITCWGRENEAKAYSNMIDLFGKEGALFAVVSDSYDIFHAASKLWGEELRQKVIDSKATLVVRPDSGDPTSTVLKVVALLDEKFGHTVNKKGFRVLNNVRVIQGDGIDPDSIQSILFALKINQYSADNIAFGMGGALLQKVDRDTFSFAQKCSAIRVGDVWNDVYKDPVGGGKTSKRGKLALVKGVLRELDHGAYSNKISFVTMTEQEAAKRGLDNHLEVVYANGELLRDQTLDEVRKIAAL